MPDLLVECDKMKWNCDCVNITNLEILKSIPLWVHIHYQNLIFFQYVPLTIHNSLPAKYYLLMSCLATNFTRYGTSL